MPLAMDMPDDASVRASAASCAFAAMDEDVSRLATYESVVVPTTIIANSANMSAAPRPIPFPVLH